MGLANRIKKGYNAFMNKDPTINYLDYGTSYGYRPDRVRLNFRNERSIINSIINRISVDASSIKILHCKTDNNDRFLYPIDSGLNYCLNTSANIDQTGRAFILDSVMSMLDEGVVALCPIDTDDDPDITGSYTIESLRVGKIVEWYPRHVKVNIYNDRTSEKKDLIFSKESVAIIENPFYSEMNSPNSTMQRLMRKLALLDTTDEHNASGKLNMIIQLPYIIRTEPKRKLAEDRLKDIESQLTNSPHGIAYVDGTEKVTQLNRPVENNLLAQIEYLTNQLLSQLGITQSILDGTADEKTMLNYYSRVIEPIISVIVDEMKRKFLTKTARTKKQTIMFFRDPFKLVPVNDLAEIVDKFTRNEVLTSNEARQIIGFKPSEDPKADELRNSNIRQPDDKQIKNIKEE